MKNVTFIPNWINGQETAAMSQKKFRKLNPANGEVIFNVARSSKNDVDKTVETALAKAEGWAATPPVQRGLILHNIVRKLIERKEEMGRMVHMETGKSLQSSIGETEGAIQCGLFYASEGQRLYGRTTTSGAINKMCMTVRQPVGVAGLIIAANTPIANVAWKVFPALICGNTAILKAAEDTPGTAWLFGQMAKEAGLPDGVLNIIQGLGEEAGAPIVENPSIGVISFTGSTRVGKLVQQIAGGRMAKVSLELGGKNPLIVCDDADLENAVKWVLLSAFSNAGQRCASGSRIIIFDEVYDKFKSLLIEKTKNLTVGTANEDDLGPVINERQLNNMLKAIKKSQSEGAKVLIGGNKIMNAGKAAGFYMAPTLIENVQPTANISRTELFGPIAILYNVKDFKKAVQLANNSPYGLTACIHTKNYHRAMEFTQISKSGVVVVNAGTFGSEPHMPFGGLRQSGNGTREPGTEALDIYSDLKDIYLIRDPQHL